MPIAEEMNRGFARMRKNARDARRLDRIDDADLKSRIDVTSRYLRELRQERVKRLGGNPRHVADPILTPEERATLQGEFCQVESDQE